jgi:hypothetical protein
MKSLLVSVVCLLLLIPSITVAQGLTSADMERIRAEERARSSERQQIECESRCDYLMRQGAWKSWDICMANCRIR